MTRDAWVEINLDHLRHNINLVKSRIKRDSGIIGVIKADAYGHGYKEVAEVFIEEGVHHFAFACLDEAIDFKKVFPDKHAMILGMCPLDCEDKVVAYGIEQSIQSYKSAKRFDDEAKKQGATAKVHLNIDTGMSRFGFLPKNEEDLAELLKIFELENVQVMGIYTHFSSSADEDREEVGEGQMALFHHVLNYIKENGYDLPKVHVSNSGAILLNDELNYDMVRMGIITYGLKPSDIKELDEVDLKPLMSLRAKVVRVREFEKDRTVGYSRTYKLTEKERIATLPLGYADGLRARCDNSYQVYMNGFRHYLAGRVCMDAMMIRVHPDAEVKIGDEVTLFGYHQDGLLPIEELSDALEYINYELACGLKLRLKRYYIKNGKFIE